MKAIVAMDLNRTIGNNGKLPWPKIKEDLSFFKKMTMHSHIIMGRKTYDSVGPLSGRISLVLTHDKEKMINKGDSFPFYVDYVDMDHVENLACPESVWVCGGAEIYKQLLPRCTEVYVTLVLNEFEGDTFMPEFEHLFSKQEIIQEHKDFWIIRYFNESTTFASCSG